MAKRATRKNASTVDVRVRMYRQGLGDCFLLRFQHPDRSVHVVIDSGLVYGAKGGKAIMQEVALDIEAETAGRIDALVITHEHYDHVSGFTQAREVWERMEVDEVWMAWTEDPKDNLAKQLRRQRAAKEKAFFEGLQAYRASTPFALDGDRMTHINGLLGFMGADLLSAKEGGKLTRAAMQAPLSGAGDRTPRYFKPGELVKDIAGVNTYVLGPPYDEAKIKRANPTKEEAYGGSGNRVGYAALGTENDAGRPFPAGHGINIGRKGQGYDRAFRELFEACLIGKEAKEDAPWRRLPTTDAYELETLAMDLDSATNNTSLVLAFELPDQRVMLFAADAQAGNWVSWHDLSWTKTETGRARTDAKALLQRTVLYKVGHHLSHNGTLKDLGLELMEDHRLVALVPLDRQQANDKGYGRTMPWPSLTKRLKERTRGRVYYSGQREKNPKVDDLADLSAAERKALERTTSVTDLYIDITL